MPLHDLNCSDSGFSVEFYSLGMTTTIYKTSLVLQNVGLMEYSTTVGQMVFPFNKYLVYMTLAIVFTSFHTFEPGSQLHETQTTFLFQ